MHSVLMLEFQYQHWFSQRDVHHPHYRDLYCENLASLVHLCRVCHRTIHGRHRLDLWPTWIFALGIAVVVLVGSLAW